MLGIEAIAEYYQFIDQRLLRRIRLAIGTGQWKGSVLPSEVVFELLKMNVVGRSSLTFFPSASAEHQVQYLSASVARSSQPMPRSLLTLPHNPAIGKSDSF